MSAQITITKDDEIAIIKVVGHPTVQEILDVNRDLTEDGAYEFEKRLWDFRNAQVDFTTAELGEIATFSRHLGQNRSKIALLVADDLTFGLSRMYQVFRETDNTTFFVFRDEGEAMRWLLSE